MHAYLLDSRAREWCHRQASKYKKNLTVWVVRRVHERHRQTTDTIVVPLAKHNVLYVRLKIKPQRTASSRALAVASVAVVHTRRRRSVCDGLDIICRRQRSKPPTDTTPLVITPFSAAVGHRRTEPGGSGSWGRDFGLKILALASSVLSIINYWFHWGSTTDVCVYLHTYDLP